MHQEFQEHRAETSADIAVLRRELRAVALREKSSARADEHAHAPRAADTQLVKAWWTGGIAAGNGSERPVGQMEC